MAGVDAIMAVIRASRPQFRNAHDKIAFAVHAAFLAAGYSLAATGPPAFSDNIFSAPPSGEVGIDGWNQTEDCYGFVYTKESKGSKITVLVKCLVMGDHLVIDALSSKNQDREPLTLDINVSEYDGASGSSSFADQYKDFPKLVTSLKSGIVSKMEDSSGTGLSLSQPRSERSERSEHNREETPFGQPLGPRYIFPQVFPGGHDDRLPGPPAGVYPRIGPDTGGPMLIGPNDPRWFRPGPPGGDYPGIADPRIPPGARFDPYGPPDVPGFDPNRFARNPRRPPGTHPDLEHFGDPDFI